MRIWPGAPRVSSALQVSTLNRSHAHMDMHSGRASEAVMVALTAPIMMDTSRLHGHDQSTKGGAWGDYPYAGLVTADMLFLGSLGSAAQMGFYEASIRLVVFVQRRLLYSLQAHLDSAKQAAKKASHD